MRHAKIKHFENYEIFEDGTVIGKERNHTRWGTRMKKDRTMKPSFVGKGRGYAQLKLTSLNGYSKTMKVHRIVAEAFIPNPENKSQVNHINGIKSDNRIENLEWVTQSENMKHAYDTGLKVGMLGTDNPRYGKTGFWKNKTGDKIPTSKRVIQMDMNNNIINTFESCNIAARYVNGSSGNISAACRGRYSQSCGYKWRYTTKDDNHLFKQPEDVKFLIAEEKKNEEDS